MSYPRCRASAGRARVFGFAHACLRRLILGPGRRPYRCFVVDEAKLPAAAEGCKRLWLVTSNDNTKALRFYQKRGFRLAALYSDALNEARKLKPENPVVGIDGIPLRDEIELELRL